VARGRPVRRDGWLTPVQALTATPRRVLGLPGHPADLVTYDADPREDLGALASPVAVDLG
jgi:hypothetical protein